MLNLPSSEGKKFSFDNIPTSISELCSKIAELYVQIPSIEIWHDDTIVSNLKLIEYAWESGYFATKEDALHICQQLTEMIQMVEKQVAKSSKFIHEEKWAENEGNYTLYYSEFRLASNHIFVVAGNTKMIYLTHNTFNSMTTTNTVFCNETEEWLKNLLRKSLILSGVAEKQRHTFFRKTQEKISDVVKKITIS
jgi:hypothetical protein